MKLHPSLALAALLAAAMSVPALAGHNMNPSPGSAARKAPPPPAGASYSAVVQSNGDLRRGTGVVSSNQPEGKGTYEVLFTADVSACAFVATVGEPASNGSEPASYITVVGRSGEPAGIFVETFDVNGHLKNFPFHVDVGC